METPDGTPEETPEETHDAINLPGTPKPWMNRVVTTMLRTPGLRQAVGTLFAVITVTGSRTGRRYSTPVQAFSDGDRYLVLSQRHRVWWRNVAERPVVELLVRGRRVKGHGHIAEGDEACELIGRLLERNPRIAKFYGIEIAEDGTADSRGVEALDRASVLIVVET